MDSRQQERDTHQHARRQGHSVLEVSNQQLFGRCGSAAVCAGKPAHNLSRSQAASITAPAGESAAVTLASCRVTMARRASAQGRGM